MFSTTLNPYFIRYNLVVELTFCLQYCLYSSMHAFVKVLEAFLWDFGPCWNDGIRQLVWISGYHFHDSCNYFVPPNHNSALLDLDLVNVEAFSVQPARCVQETSLGLYKHCDMGHYPAESSSYNMAVKDCSLNDTWLVQSVPGKKHPPHIFPPPAADTWVVDTRKEAFVFFLAKFWPLPSECWSRNRNLSETKKCFSSFLLSSLDEHATTVASVSSL